MIKGWHRLLLPLACLACVPGAAHAQDHLIGTESALTIEMPGQGERRAVWISVPPGYERSGATRYPVAYVLDGRGLFPGAVAAARFLSVFEGAPGMIVVGIDSVNPAARRRDLTPVRAASDAEGASGQADRFAAFLAGGIVPRINMDFRTDGRAVLIGHSLAGLFALDAWHRRLPAFDGYIAISPTLPWADNEIMGRIASRAKGSSNAKAPFVFVSMAADTPAYLAQMERLESMAPQLAPAWQFARFPDDTHVTTVPGALFRGLRLYHQHLAAGPPKP